MYTLLACADMFGEKMNLELTFAGMPTIGELTRKIEETYRSEAEFKRPANFPREYEFRVARLQIYDDVLLKWVDLVTATQLHEYDQLYVFQPQSPWHIDVQKDLPPPRPPSSMNRIGVASYSQPPYAGGSYATTMGGSGGGGASSVYGSGSMMMQQQHQASYYSGAANSSNVSDDEKARVVFTEMDTDRDGYVSNRDLREGFLSRGIDFNESTVGETLCHSSQRDGLISYVDFLGFARRFPNTLEALYYRSNAARELAAPPGVRETEERLRAQKNREAELLKELERVRSESHTLEQKHAQEAEAARRQMEARRVLDDQERQLLQKEMELQRQRDLLRQTEAEFIQSARNFDVHSAQTGSPRRARTHYA